MVDFGSQAVSVGACESMRENGFSLIQLSHRNRNVRFLLFFYPVAFCVHGCF